MIKFNVYALNWNESRLIPAFLHHYREAHRIIVYDNESTDDSVHLIRNAGREVVSFNTNNFFDDQTNIDLKNNIWKAARNEHVDFVIVQDLDEFIYFPKYPDSLSQALLEYKTSGITCANSIGYNIVCTDSEWDSLLSNLNGPEYNLVTNPIFDPIDICQVGAAKIINRGYRFMNEDKVLLFNPVEIIETHYSPGAHSWSPVGKVVYPKESPALLHYKYVGKLYSQDMIIKKRDRLSEKNKMNSWGWEYLVSDAEIAEKLSGVEEINCVPITRAIHEYYEKLRQFNNILTTIIVLERDLLRIANVQEKCIPYLLNYRIQPAMDGSNSAAMIDFQEKNNISISKIYMDDALTGALGCSFSHMQAWDFQINNNLNHMIILEDDALLDKNFLLDSNNVFSEVDEDYDIVYLYVYPDHYKTNAEICIEGKEFINYGYKTWCTVAYLLSLKGAKKLWDHLQRNISDNVDNIIGDMIESKSINAYSSKKQFVKCIGQNVPWDNDPGKLTSNIWSSDFARTIFQE